MRAVRFTKAEGKWLRDLMAWAMATNAQVLQDYRKLHHAVVAKLDAAEAPAAAGVAAGPIEAALVRTSRGMVVELASGAAGYSRASKLATQVGATVEDAELVGAWLARQGWLRDPTTVLGVLNKWVEWLPRARAVAPPPAAQEGYGAGDAGQGADRPGSRGGSGRRGEGFR